VDWSFTSADVVTEPMVIPADATDAALEALRASSAAVIVRMKSTLVNRPRAQATAPKLRIDRFIMKFPFAESARRLCPWRSGL
jgi:hypothetical protein